MPPAHYDGNNNARGNTKPSAGRVATNTNANTNTDLDTAGSHRSRAVSSTASGSDRTGSV
jgi:hypothetical protein